ADQGLLNEQFSDWSASAPYRRLPFLYNATANVYYTYEPAMQRFGHDVRVVHFIGVSKPWHWNRTPGGGLVADAQVSERWRQLVMLWWHIHDEHVSGWRYWKGPFDKDLAMGKGYHHITEPLTPPPQVEVPQQQTGYGIYDVPRHQQHQPGNDDGTYAEPEHQPTDEVPDWDKDWSWANDRVHPFDYAYLA
ncbi:glycogenin glucosyltransferase, partial [Linderina pennispora]